MLFWRTNTDKTRTEAHLRNAYAGTEPSACWIVGAGPSLGLLDKDVLAEIQGSPAAKMAVNYAGRGPDGKGWLLKPTHWTAYDTTARFSRSVFNDPTIQKFVRSTRHADLLPEGTEKLCDAPNTVFFDYEFRKYSNFVDPLAGKVNDSLDSLVQAIDLAYLLGFRELYLLGTEMRIKPSQAQIDLADSVGVTYPVVMDDGRASDRLLHFRDAYAKAKGISKKEAADAMEAVDREKQYAFCETKPFSSAVSCDTHYYDRVQYLRLARKTLALNGLKLVSCTRGSRLNTWFDFMEPEAAVARIYNKAGDARDEHTAGKYTEKRTSTLPWHNDLAPYYRHDKLPEKKPIAPAVEKLQGVEVPG